MAENIEQLRTVEPTDSTHEGCPVRVKTRHVTISKGVPGIVKWPLRDENGHTIDLSEILPTDQGSLSETGLVICGDAQVPPPVGGAVQVRYAPCDVVRTKLYEIVGEAYQPASGVVRFKVPNPVYDTSGVYRMQIGIFDTSNQLVVTDSGLLFVEPSLWGDMQDRPMGPPSLKEIRTYIRDTVVENDFLKAVEFTDDEIITALVAPVREWNEMLPPVSPFTCATFPYREMWIKGTLGHLCRMAAAWYLRNKMQTSHGGLSVDDRNKNAEYSKQSEMYLTEWRTAARAMKVRINIGRAFGTITGPYY